MYRVKLEGYISLLNEDLIKMCSLIDENISKSIKMLSTHSESLISDIENNEKLVNDFEKEIEGLCLKIILKQQPVAADLRLVSTALKIITDLERISDQTLDMAYLINKLSLDKGDKVFDLLIDMASLSKTMVKDSTLCFTNNDYLNATNIISKDKAINEYLMTIKKAVVSEIKNDSEHISDLVNILLIAKYLEKISDHAKNICEWTIFLNTGIHKDKEIL